MITLQQIRFKNILSFGNTPTTIDFESSNSFLIKGVNGSGKSAGVLDTLCFALFGKPFRKINKPNLLNYKNRKEMLVELWFKNDFHEYHILRGLNPQFFEIYEDEVLVNQNPNIRDYQAYFEANILHMDFQSFTQIVILGKATYVAFFRLALHERRRFIENILNLSVFGLMSDLNKVKIAELKGSLVILKTEIQILKERIQLKERHIETLQQEHHQQQENHKRQINNQIRKQKLDIEDYEKQISALRSSFEDVDHDLTALNQRLNSNYEIQKKFQDKIKNIQRKLVFFRENATCPTCDTELNEKVRKSKTKELMRKKDTLETAELEIGEKIGSILLIIQEIKQKLEQNNKYQKEIETIETAIGQKIALIAQLSEEGDLQTKGSFEENINSETKEVAELKALQETKLEERMEILSRLEYYDFILGMLKDSGIKAVIIKRYIPTITRIMNNYLNHLELFVRFELNENFEETFYSRGINPLNYHAFSEGEKLRIDLAMLMTWRELCKLQSNMNVNFIIFDEILDASLDETGSENLVNLFSTLNNTGTKIMVISHTSDRWEDKFDKSLTFTKQSGFSMIKES